ncbi:MAG: YigZ family protein [Clostridia bacterium]
MNEFLVPFTDGEDIIIEKKSKFIGKIIKIESETEAKEHLAKIRKDNPGAVHNCFAYIVKSENIERFSDDGEPQGTAGMPILEVLRHENVTNVLCVVTRYFGGTLLGTGGLVRAYNQTAKKALVNAGIAQMLPFYDISIACEYAMYDILQKNFEDFTIFMGEIEYTDKITINLSVLAEEYDALEQKITEISSGTIKPTKIDETYRGKQIDFD